MKKILNNPLCNCCQQPVDFEKIFIHVHYKSGDEYYCVKAMCQATAVAKLALVAGIAGLATLAEEEQERRDREHETV